MIKYIPKLIVIFLLTLFTLYGSLKSFYNNKITINLNNPDEGCDLDFIPKEARDMKIDVSLNNSFGFGGTNSTLIFKSV